nr:MAG TPA: TREPONEMA DENTICOLA VARIABLE PROTEIN 1 FUNCTION, PERIODONTAL DISEASE [Bacteriophage sp.]
MVSNGYKTEIKATPTCDFFATSVSGGSETTYWCDYNWDNTDASEHCLLIGGHSDSGGRAGLFYLTSNIGVGASNADIGSRLTYLPWAE